MTELMAPPRWMDRGACQYIDPDIFFPDKGEMNKVRWAKQICRGNDKKGIPECPVLMECFEYAMRACEQYGIWGGVTARERMILRGELADDDAEDAEVAA